MTYGSEDHQETDNTELQNKDSTAVTKIPELCVSLEKVLKMDDYLG